MDSTAGWSWQCDKDGDGCSHVTKACHYLQQLVQWDPKAQDPFTDSQNASGELVCHGFLFSMLIVGGLDVSHAVGMWSPRSNVVSVSHLPIPPSNWALLPEDSPCAHEQALPVLQVPHRISLDEGAHCIYGCSQRMDETTFQDCVVYTLVTAQQTLLEVQLCQKCPHILQRFIGPDGRHLGLCNLNNSVVFTHDLLDDYMANFTSSETPFLAWVSAMQKRYTRQGSLLLFTHEAVFHNAWFSYSSLQQLEGDMKCPKCGPAPKDVIWDSVLLSFHCKHLLPSLHPLTMVDKKSLVCNSRYHIQTPIENLKLCCAMQKIVEAALALTSENSTANSAHDPGIEGNTVGVVEKAPHDVAGLIELILKTHESLKRMNEALAACFYSHIGLTAVNSGILRHKEYMDLFWQVRIILYWWVEQLCIWCIDR